MRSRLLQLVLLVTAFLLGVLALPALAVAPVPGTCVDEVGVLGRQTCLQVASVLDADEVATTDEIAVLVVDSTDGTSIEAYAEQVFNEWGVGQAEQDNGVLLVVALQDHALRIQTGTGLADRLSDGQASEIVGGTIVPEFRAGAYRQGILDGLDAIRVALGHPVDTPLATIPADPGYTPPSVGSDDAVTTDAAENDVASQGSDTSSDSGSNRTGTILLVVLFIAVLVVVAVFRSSDGGGGSGWSGRRSGWSGGRSWSSGGSRSSGGSSGRRSGGFGGGRSSGGGASGRW